MKNTVLDEEKRICSKKNSTNIFSAKKSYESKGTRLKLADQKKKKKVKTFLSLQAE